MEIPRLDRTAFRAGSFKDADDHYRHDWRDATPAERLRAAWYLTSVAFRFALSDPPRLDRTAFSTRSWPRG